MTGSGTLSETENSLIRELRTVPLKRLIGLIRAADLSVDTLRGLIRTAHPEFKTDDTPHDPSAYLDNLTNPELAEVLVKAKIRSDSDLRDLAREYQHDYSAVFNLFTSYSDKPLPAPESSDFVDRFNEELTKINRELLSSGNQIRKIRLVEGPEKHSGWDGWQIKWSYERMIDRRRPEDALLDPVPDLRYGYVWVIPALKRLIIQTSDSAAVNAINKAINAAFDLQLNRAFRSMRLHDKLFASIIREERLTRVSYRGGSLPKLKLSKPTGTDSFADQLKQLDSMSLTSRFLGNSSLPSALENAAEMERTATTYSSVVADDDEIRPVFLSYRRGRISAAGQLSLSDLRRWAWIILKAARGIEGLKPSDRNTIVRTTSFDDNDIAKRLPAGPFREAFNRLVEEAAVMVSYESPLTSKDLPEEIHLALARESKYFYPTLIQWECSQCNGPITLTCSRCNNSEFWLSEKDNGQVVLQCADEHCGTTVSKFSGSAPKQTCIQCGYSEDALEYSTEYVILTPTPEGNRIILEQLDFISTGYAKVRPSPKDLFQLRGNQLTRIRPQGSPRIELSELSEYRKAAIKPDLSKSEEKKLRDYALKCGEMCNFVKGQKTDKYHRCATCYADIPDRDNPCLFRLMMAPQEKELFTGHAATEFADQFFEVTWRDKTLRAAVFGKVEEIGTMKKLTHKSSSGANLLSQVMERHRHPMIDLVVILTYSPIDENLKVQLDQLCIYGGKKILYTGLEDIKNLAHYYQTSW